MKKITVLTTTFLCLLLFTFCAAQKNKDTTMEKFGNGDHDATWITIDSLENEGLPQSALAELEKLYDKVKDSDDVTTIWRCLIYRSKYTVQLEEDGTVKSIQNLEAELAKSDFPLRPLLETTLGEMYQNYLNNNFWQIRNRSERGDFDPTFDVLSWSPGQLINRSRDLYLASLQDDRIKSVAISSLDPITSVGLKTDYLRPTMYDLLAFRAISHFSSGQSFLTEPAYKFNLQQAEAFASWKDFIDYKFETRDTSSKLYQTVLIFQDLLRHHQNDSDKRALIDADLQRLNFAHQQSTRSDKEDLYLKQLENLETTYRDQATYSEICAAVANVYSVRGQNYQPGPEAKGKDAYIKAFDYSQKGIDAFPESYGAEICRSIQALVRGKNIQVQSEEVNLPNRDFLALVNYRNVSKIWLRVVSISPENWDKYQERNYDQQLDFVKRLPNIKTWSVDLPDPKDYHQHSVEVKIDALPTGRYAILVSDNDDFTQKNHTVGFLFTQVSNLALIQRPGKTGTYEFVVMDRTTGNPVADAKIQSYLQGRRGNGRRWIWSKGKNTNTDASGYASLAMDQGTAFTVDISKGDDRLISDLRLRTYPDQTPRKKQFTHFFLDRKIYRPGQTVYFKALVLETDEKSIPQVVANQKVSIQFIDANYQMVETMELETNSFGTVQGSFTAPRIGLLGQMQLSSSQGGSVSFRVEEYKRPTFEVTFDAQEQGFRLGDQVVVKGKAKAYAGSSIDGAQVQYRVVRRVSYPHFSWWRWSYWRPQRPQMEVLNGVTTTNPDGSFEIAFVAQADPSTNPEYQPQFDFQVTADITDLAGETRSGNTNVPVGYLALKVDLQMPDRMSWQNLDSIGIKTTNLSGTFEPAEGRVIIEKLQNPQRTFREKQWRTPDQFLYTQEEYYRLFPSDTYREEDRKENYAVDKGVEQNVFNTANSKSISLDRGRYEVGWYKLTLRTQDRYGSKIEQEKYFQIFDLEKEQLAPGNALLFYQNQDSYQVGDKATLSIGSSFFNQKVLFELERQGQVLRREWLTMDQFAAEQEQITESYRGNLHYSFSFVRENRLHTHKGSLIVPWSNKDLKLEYATFREKLYPGAPEKWQIKVSGAQKDRVAAEVLATMYDASLDAFAANDWSFNPHPTYHKTLDFRPMGFGLSSAQFRQDNWNQHYSPSMSRSYRGLNWFGLYYAYGRYNNVLGAAAASPILRSKRSMSLERSAAPEAEMDFAANEVMVMEDMLSSDVQDIASPGEPDDPNGESETDFSEVKVRTNLKETVFFFPDLKTDANGDVIIEFEMNEALTRWKFLLFAHTQQLESTIGQREVVTQKELMVQPNAPRFLRESDEIVWTAKVSNISENDLSGTAKLELFDALTMKPIDVLLGNDQQEVKFTAVAGQSAPLQWKLKIPLGQVSAITHRVVAQATNPAGDTFSDGEESSLPVMTNRMLVTESLPLTAWGNQERTYVFERLQETAKSPTLQHHRLTLEYTSNPAWYAVQSLPYLMEYPYDCTEQIFSRFYANSLATSVANAHPKVKEVFDAWKGTDAMMSNLTKNQELKSVLLEETPWVLDAQSEEQQRQNIALLFDLNKMADEQTATLKKLLERQESDGGFSWFPGGRSSRYITQYLVEGLGHLDQLGVDYPTNEDQTTQLIANALKYIDGELTKEYRELKRRAKSDRVDLEKDHLSNLAIHYLYARSFFLTIPWPNNAQEAIDYYRGQAQKYWLKKGVQQQGLLSLALHRMQDTTTPTKILKSLSERAIRHDDLGMYWKMDAGYFWYEHPIETQALLIEAYQEITSDAQTVDQLRAWLLKNKQTSQWKTTKATAAAVYALLIDDNRQKVNSWLLDSKPLQVTIGGKKVKPAPGDLQAGTGYYKTSWRGDEIKAKMAEVKLKNDNDVLAWGGLYWQYFEDLDKITNFEETPLQLKKQLFLEEASDRGPVLTALNEGTTLQPGDKVIVRIELRVDRPMEFIHLKDMRGSGFEPLNVLSQYKWQDGLGYYESTRDASTNFFMDYLPRGTYVFEYPLRASHAGDFSNGISSIQCMYAPEFSSHSEGVRVKIK